MGGSPATQLTIAARLKAARSAKRMTLDELAAVLRGAKAEHVVTTHVEVVDAVLGHGAHVHVREDSSRYRCSHDAWRTITAGGRVIHAAEGQS